MNHLIIFRFTCIATRGEYDYKPSMIFVAQWKFARDAIRIGFVCSDLIFFPTVLVGHHKYCALFNRQIKQYISIVREAFQTCLNVNYTHRLGTVANWEADILTVVSPSWNRGHRSAATSRRININVFKEHFQLLSFRSSWKAVPFDSVFHAGPCM